jgi:hypothetical protein
MSLPRRNRSVSPPWRASVSYSASPAAIVQDRSEPLRVKSSRSRRGQVTSALPQKAAPLSHSNVLWVHDLARVHDADATSARRSRSRSDTRVTAMRTQKLLTTAITKTARESGAKASTQTFARRPTARGNAWTSQALTCRAYALFCDLCTSLSFGAARNRARR